MVQISHGHTKSDANCVLFIVCAVCAILLAIIAIETLLIFINQIKHTLNWNPPNWLHFFAFLKQLKRLSTYLPILPYSCSQFHNDYLFVDVDIYWRMICNYRLPFVENIILRCDFKLLWRLDIINIQFAETVWNMRRWQIILQRFYFFIIRIWAYKIQFSWSRWFAMAIKPYDHEWHLWLEPPQFVCQNEIVPEILKSQIMVL